MRFVWLRWYRPFISLEQLATWDALTNAHTNNINGRDGIFCSSLAAITGGPGLGLRGDGYGPTVPLAVLDGFHYRHICYFMRGAVPLR